MWSIYYPPLLPDEVCKVVTYVRVDLDRSVVIRNHTNHPLASASSMVLDVATGDKTLRIINIYHHIPSVTIHPYFSLPPQPSLSPRQQHQHQHQYQQHRQHTQSRQ